MLKVGFARVDISPSLGVSIQGSYKPRYAQGVRDPLYATAVTFDDGEKRIAVISLDLIGINMAFMAGLRGAVAEAIETDVAGIFITCTHTHYGPTVAPTTAIPANFPNPEYGEWLIKRVADTAVLAANDLAPVEKLLYTQGEAKDVSFIRRYRMKDGKSRTNPGFNNPDILHMLTEPDDQSQLLIIKREGKPEIGIVNFQVHADVMGGSEISADYPQFVRNTYELNIPNSRCMYINGTNGDANHFDLRLNPDKDCWHGPMRARYMGKKIAMSVLANYELAKELEGDKVGYAAKVINVKFNKGKPEEIPAAVELAERYYKYGLDVALPESNVPGMSRAEIISKATRIYQLMSMPDNKELLVTAVSVGDVVFAGFPGEPFTEMGRQVKNNSPFTLTIPACCANGFEGYYPMEDAFAENGYEANASRYVAGTAEKLLEASLETINTLK